MRYFLVGFYPPLWTESPMPPKVAVLLAAAGIICIVLSTMFGVSPLSNWLLYAAQALLALGATVFTLYIFSGIIRDARTM
jgi:type IV secretory pathway VirB2 component (pilin)